MSAGLGVGWRVCSLSTTTLTPDGMGDRPRIQDKGVRDRARTEGGRIFKARTGGRVFPRKETRWRGRLQQVLPRGGDHKLW